MSGGQFPIPATSPTPLLALRCTPAIRPYLAEDATTLSPQNMAILIDAPVVYSWSQKVMGHVILRVA